MKLFIANCTRSHWNMHLKVPEGKTIRLDIKSGHQRAFPVDLSQAALDEVVSQLQKWGGRPRKDVHGKLSNFGGIVYSLDKPLNEEEIVSANEDQLDAAQTRSVEQATNSALASDLGWREGQDPKGKRKARSTGISVHKKDAAKGTEEPMMDVEVTEKGSSPRKRPR